MKSNVNFSRKRERISASWHHQYVNRLSIKTRARVCESDENLLILCSTIKRFIKIIFFRQGLEFFFDFEI